jgi:hypothetical protein
MFSNGSKIVKGRERDPKNETLQSIMSINTKRVHGATKSGKRYRTLVSSSIDSQQGGGGQDTGAGKVLHT